MPIKLFDSKETVPAELQATAVELKDGKWAVAEEDPALGDAGRRALEAERTARAAADTARKAAEKERDELKRAADAKAAGISEVELQKIRDAEVLARKPIEDENATLKAENRRLKLTDRVQALALKHGVMPDRIEDAMLALSMRTDLTDGDGIVVKGKDGKVTTETIDDFLSKTFKAEKGWLYAGTGANGGGSLGSDGGGAGDGGYDPVSAGKAAAADQKKGREENKLAFT